MACTGKEAHSISLTAASELTSNYRASLSAEDSPIIGGYFGGEAISAILAQDGCVGIRYYYGLDESGTSPVPVIVIVGVDDNCNDMSDGLLAEMSVCCPPVCSASNPLNSD
jgi:hypothetical protein